MGVMKTASTERMLGGGKKGPMQILGSVGVFFDGEEINKRKDKQRHKALMAAGAFVRTQARGLIKPGGKKGKTSGPGEPPRWQVKPGIKSIFFVYDKKTDGVIIGPVKMTSAGPKILKTLEGGGSIKAIRRNPKTKKKETRVIKIAKRPFMSRAKKEALPELMKQNPYFKKLIGGSDIRLPR